MSTICWTPTNIPAATGRQRAIAAPKWQFWAAAVLVGLVFFITEHSLSISLADAYTQTAEEMELTALGGNTIRRLAFFALAALGLWLLATGKQPLRISPWLAAPLGGYLLLAAASCLWSVDPGMCLRRLIVLGCCTLAAAGIARRFSLAELCRLGVAIIGPLVLVGLATEVFLGTFRPWSSDYRFAGSVHPNTQGMYLTALALSTIGVLHARAPSRGWLWIILAACVVLVVLTKSRTGAAASLVALAAVYLVHTPWRRMLVVGLTAVWLGLAGLWLVTACGYDPLTDFRDALLLGRSEESETLSGRAFIWPLVLSFIARRPWLGYGYESFWNPANIDLISGDLEWGVREAHSGYLDLLLSTGLVGLALALLTVAAALMLAIRGSVRQRTAGYALPLGMLIFGLLSSWMESGMVTVMLPPFLAGCCLMRMALFEEPLTTHHSPLTTHWYAVSGEWYWLNAYSSR